MFSPSSQISWPRSKSFWANLHQTRSRPHSALSWTQSTQSFLKHDMLAQIPKNAAKKDKWMIDRWLMVDNYDDDDYYYYDDYDTFPTDPIETSAKTWVFSRPMTSPHPQRVFSIHFATTFSNHTPQKIPPSPRRWAKSHQLWGETTLDPLKGIKVFHPPTRVHPNFFHQVSESRPRPPVIQGTFSKISVLVKKTYVQYAWFYMNTDILYILIIYQKNKYIQSAYTSPPNAVFEILDFTSVSRPCWTAAAPSSPQSQCAAAYNVDRVFPAPQGIHPENTGNSPGWWSRCFGWMCFFSGFPKIFKNKKRKNVCKTMESTNKNTAFLPSQVTTLSL